MSYGVTTEGFVIKRLETIKEEIESDFRDTFGKGIDLSDESPLGQMVGIFAERESKIWELAESVYNAAYPDTAEGVPLDNAVALTGVTRRGETYSTVTAILIGDAGTVIPQGSVASVVGSASARFVTDADFTVEPAVDEVQTLSFGGRTPTGGSWSLGFDGETTVALAFNASDANVQAALRALPNLSDDLTVAGSFAAGLVVTFAGDDGAKAQPSLTFATNTLADGSGAIPGTVAEIVAGKPAQVEATLTSESPGAVQAPAGSLTVIETPISGWDSISNPLDAEVGFEVESDSALKIRRAESVEKAGASTAEAIRAGLLELEGVENALVFQNTSMVLDQVSGRPAKSIEAMVEGGEDAVIAKAIWEDKPAGMETHGSTSVAITDSQGFARTVKFSRPISKAIYLELDLTTNSEFPENGVDLVKAEMVAYGETRGLGDNVVVFPALVAFLNNVPGITDVVVRIATEPAPTADDNIVMATFELADFDTSRIEVNVL